MKPGEIRAFHDDFLLKAVFREALRALEDETMPPNIAAIHVGHLLRGFQHGLVDYSEEHILDRKESK